MIAQQQTPRQRAAAREAARKATPRPRPLSLSQVGAAIAAGGHIRIGTVLRSAFPQSEFQVFNAAGEFVAAVAKSALPQAVTAYGVDKRKGINR